LVEEQANHPVKDLVSTALCQDQPSGICEMLRSLALSMDAYGCLLWEAARPPGGGHGTEGQLYVLAQWVQDSRIFAIHDLPFDSAPGDAILRNIPVVVSNLSSDAGAHELSLRAGVKSLCCVPLTFHDGARGAVEIYWQSSRALEESDVRKLEDAVSLVPALYQSITDKVSYKLMGAVNEAVQEGARRSLASTGGKEWAGEIFDRLAALLASTFRCLEVAIFLEDRLQKPGAFELAATTCPDYLRKVAYFAGEEGPTGWVLQNHQSVIIFDLTRFERDREQIQVRYPGLDWKDWLDVRSTSRRLLQLRPDEELPPASFMAAPVAVGDKVLGVVRCCTATHGPFYFSNRDVGLLSLSAAHIAQFWANSLAAREMADENRGWRNLVTKMTQLNQLVHNELRKERPQERNIFAEGLRVASEVIEGADILDVRLLDEEAQELYFAETRGKEWKQGTDSDVQNRLAQRYPVTGTPDSAGAHVFQTGQVMHEEEIEKCTHYRKLFPNVKRMICAPISSAKVKFGVLGICGTRDRPFRIDAPTIARLLGEQLGLYHFLAITIDRLNEIVRQQAETYEDLKHQLNSPIIQARIRVREALTAELLDDDLEYRLLAIRGLLRKAGRVAQSAGLFADLARRLPLRIKSAPLLADGLAKSLIEAGTDNKLLAPKRGIDFRVDTVTFDALSSWNVEADPDLLEQVINNVLDNAFKYSFSSSYIRIYGAIAEGGERFCISLVNRGIPINADQAREAVRRGWRSPEARWATGEGTGIGLWIVDHIMKAHGGELRIVPTNDQGLTEVKLLFPCSRKPKG